MKATITNHHCDSRDIPIPGTRKIIRIPAFASVDVIFSSTEQMQETEILLAIKAPAVRINVAESGNLYPITDDLTLDTPNSDNRKNIEAVDSASTSGNTRGKADIILKPKPQKLKRRVKS